MDRFCHISCRTALDKAGLGVAKEGRDGVAPYDDEVKVRCDNGTDSIGFSSCFNTIFATNTNVLATIFWITRMTHAITINFTGLAIVTQDTCMIVASVTTINTRFWKNEGWTNKMVM